MDIHKSQVVICGAGTAGLPAALSAARLGLEVIVIEEDWVIGGSAIDYCIQCFCGEPLHGTFLELKKIIQKYTQENNSNCFRTASFITAWQELLKGLPISIYIGQKIKNVITSEDGKIIAVESDSARFESDIFIDATGDAAIAIKTKCEVRMGREAADEYGELFAPQKADKSIQMCTLMYSLKRIEGSQSKEDANWAKFNDDEYLMWGPTVVCKDPTDLEKYRIATQAAYAQLNAQAELWREKGFLLTDVAPKLGVRETRRIVGDYVLSYNDVMEKKEYNDTICIAHYPIDPWEPEGNPLHDEEIREKCTTPYYEIPYRCLVTRKVPNLLVVGRCISATHVVNSSLRVMGIAIITGQAAGIAAKLAIDENVAVSDINTNKLRELLHEQGVKTSLKELM